MNFKNLVAVSIAIFFIASFIPIVSAQDVVTVEKYISGSSYELDHSHIDDDPTTQSLTAYCPADYEVIAGECSSNYLTAFGNLYKDIDNSKESVTCSYKINFPFACGEIFQINCPWIETTATCLNTYTPPEPECDNDSDCNPGFECDNGDCVETPVVYKEVKISGVPDKTIKENYNYSTEIADLFDYTTHDPALTANFAIESQSNGGLINCYIDNSHIVECSPPTDNMTGSNRITVRVLDSQGQTDSDIFYVYVEEEEDPDPVNNEPTISNLPDLSVEENGNYQNNAIYLPAFADDDDNDNLSFSITNQTNESLVDCSIDSYDYIDCSEPAYNQTGVNTVTVKVSDGKGGYDTDSFSVVVNEEDDPDPNYDKPYWENGFNGKIIYFTENQNSGLEYYLPNYVDYSGDDSELNFFKISQSNYDIVPCNVNGKYLVCERPTPNEYGNVTIFLRVKNPDNEYNDAELTIKVLPENQDSRCEDIKIRAYNRTMDENERKIFTVSIENKGESEFFIKDTYIQENSNYLQVIDSSPEPDNSNLSEDEKTELEIEFESENVSSNKNILIEIMLKGEFDDGEHCYFSDINEDFTLTIVNEGTSSDSTCGDITIVKDTLRMDESDTDTLYFTIKNNGDSDFEVEDLELDEKSTNYLTILDFDNEGEIRENDEKEFLVKLRSPSVSGDKIVTIEVNLKGRFNDGEYCSISEIGYEYFKVKIENQGSSTNTDCDDITLSVSDTTVLENSTKTKNVTIKNNSNRTFDLDTVKVEDTSTYFYVEVDDEPSRVYSNNSETIELKIHTENVSSDKTGEAEVIVTGEFSDGKKCTGTSITKEFDVTVDNTSSNYDDEDDEPSTSEVEIDLSEAFVTLNENESKTVSATITNKSESRECFDLSVDSSTLYSTTLSESNICVNGEESETARITFVGEEPGTDNAQFKVSYGSKSKSKFISVEVLGETGEAPEVGVAEVPEFVEDNAVIILENTGERQESVSIRALDATNGVTFESITESEWEHGETIEIPIKFEEGFEGEVEAIIRVSSATGTTSIPLSFEVSREDTGGTTGLINLATTAGLAIGLIILLILAVIGVLSFFSKN